MKEKIDDETVRQIFELRDMGHSIRAIADMTNLHYNTVHKYLRKYKTYSEYMKQKIEREIKQTMNKSQVSHETAVKRVIDSQLRDITASELAKLYSYAYTMKKYENIAHELNMTTEELIRRAVRFYTQLYPRYKELEEENRVLREAIAQIIEILDEESFNKRLQMYAIEKAIEKMEKEDIMRLFKTLWGGVNGGR